jgi:phage baseplate assembly protein gpV
MADVVRFGKVSNIDYEAGSMEITYADRDDSVTDKIGMISNREYQMPEVGQTVAVIHNSNGAEDGAVLGGLWSEKEKPPEGFEGLYRKDFDKAAGKCMFRYDGKSGESKFHNDGDHKVELKKNKTEAIEGDEQIEIKGKLTLKVGSCTVEIDGSSVTVTAPSEVSITASTATVTASTVNITGGSGDVVVSGISLKNHQHTSAFSGSPTSAPIP